MTHRKQKAESIMSMVQSLIYNHRARTDPPRDPLQIHVTGEQYDTLKLWGEDRPLQTSITFRNGDMFYEGVKLLISSRRK